MEISIVYGVIVWGIEAVSKSRSFRSDSLVPTVFCLDASPYFVSAVTLRTLSSANKLLRNPSKAVKAFEAKIRS